MPDLPVAIQEAVMLGLMALALQVAVPSAEAEALGRRLAAAGGLATMVPMLVETDLTELAAEQPELTPAERERLFAIGHAEGAAGRAKLIAALGHAYAARLSVADLRLLVANAEAPATRRLRVIEPMAIATTMQSMGEMDLKKTVAAQLCKETGKRCGR